MFSYAEITPIMSIYRTKEIRKEKNPNGTWKREVVGATYYKTEAGELKEDEWNNLAAKTIEEHGDALLLRAIEAHVRKNCIWLKDSEILPYSTHCLVERAYKAWEERGEFIAPTRHKVS